MTKGMRISSPTSTEHDSGRSPARPVRHAKAGAAPELRRTESRDGIARKALPDALNATERHILSILDNEFVTAKEIAGFAGVSVEQCRRGLATLRTLGMAELERPRRKNATNVWRRA
jgi:hypothetical protein